MSNLSMAAIIVMVAVNLVTGIFTGILAIRLDPVVTRIFRFLKVKAIQLWK